MKPERLKGLSYAKALQPLSPQPPTDEAVLDAFKDVVGRSREEVSTAPLSAFELETAAQARLAEWLAQYPWQVLARVRLEIYAEMLADQVHAGSLHPKA